MQASAKALSEQPSHQTILAVLETQMEQILKRLEAGDRKFERMEKTMENKVDGMSVKVDELAAEVTALKVDFASVVSSNQKPWYFGWKPMAVFGISCALAGAGALLLYIVDKDIFGKLQAISGALSGVGG